MSRIEQIKQILQRRSTYCKDCVSWRGAGAGTATECNAYSNIESWIEGKLP